MGKSESFVRHIADLKLGHHKGSRRVWLEGRRLADVGFNQGVRYQAGLQGDALVLRLSKTGDHTVSHKAGRPVVDLLTRGLGDVERIQARFSKGSITITLHPIDRQAAARLARLNARLADGQTLRLGSLSHGGGVASEALLRGLGNSSLAFALDIEGRYVNQSLEAGPLRAGGLSIEADLGDVDPSDLPQVEVLEAGLPCVAASRAGRSKKHLAQAEDDEQVADLAAAFCEVVRAVQPAIIVLENVPEYASSASAQLIRRRLGRFGYELHETIVDGAAWSLENRQRWILVAVTRGLVVDLGALVPSGRPTSVGEVLDRKVPATAWRRFAHLDSKQKRDTAKGSGFVQQLVTASSPKVPTLRRGYQKAGSTDPRLAHPTRPGVSRLFSPAEHARIKGIPPQLIKGASDKMAHEILGQSVISPAFVALGQLVAGSVA